MAQIAEDSHRFKIGRVLAQDICDRAATELDTVVSMMGEAGEIFASSERARIGTLHDGAAAIMRGDVDSYEVSGEASDASPVMREGYLLPVDVGGERVAVLGVAGRVELAKPCCRIAHQWARSIVELKSAEQRRSDVERRLAQAQLAAREAELQGLLRGSIQGTAIISGIGRILHANEKFLEIHGLEPATEAVAGEQIKRFVETAHHGLFDKAARDAVEEGGDSDAAGVPIRYLARCQGRGSAWVEARIRGLSWDGAPAVQLSLVDVTAQIAAEAAASATASSLRDAIETMPDGICMFDADLRIQVYNQRFLALWGVGDDVLARCQTMYELISYLGEHGYYGEQDTERVRRHRIALMRSGQPFNETYYLANGRILTLRGQPRSGGGYVIAYTDVTEQNRIEQELAESRQLLESVLESMPVVVDVKDRQSRYVLVNSFQAKVLGFDAKEAIGKTPHDVLEPELAESIRREDLEVIEFGREIPFSEQSFMDASGRQRHLLTTKVPLLDEKGVVSRVVSIGMDIGDVKQANDRWKRSEIRLRGILGASPVGVEIADSNELLLWANDRYCELFAIEREEMIGTDMSWKYADPDIAATKEGEAAGLGGKAFRELEFLKRAGGRWHGLMSSHESEFAGIPCNVNWYLDISERKRAESELVSTKEQAVRAYEELRETQESLIQAEKLASLGGLVAGVAHEINTPIGICVTATTLQMEQAATFRSELEAGKVRKSTLNSFLDHVESSARLMFSNLHRASELVQSFKQISVDQTSAERRSFDLAEYIDEILLSYSPKIKKTSHQVLYEKRDEIVINSYPGVFYQIIGNFINNSILHAFDEAEHGVMRIDLREAVGGGLELVFEDNGRGIAKTGLKKIFEPFYTTKRGAGGSGLGLNIVFNLVKKNLGGSIKVDSELGHGVKFTVHFPRSDPS